MTSPSAYLARSAVLPLPDGSAVALETARGLTPAGVVEHPEFFNGLLARPDVVASGLLAVARVAGTRYSIDLAELRRNLDPIVTAGGDRLRFESFSECNGVHARLDILGEGVASGEMSFGTTNVDINQPLRSALGRMRSSDLVHLAVGADALRVSSPDETHEERRVDMPKRWVRGLAETPWLARGMDHRATLAKAALVPFLNSLSRTGSGQTFHLVPTPNGLRMSGSATPRSVFLAGAGRLAVLTSVARIATRLDVYAHPGGSSGWVAHLPHARLTLLLSPGAYRGFSGEGSVLVPLSHPGGDVAAETLHSHLQWQPVIDPARLAGSTGLTEAAVRGGLAHLAVSGRVGFDLTEQAWFHRELPFDPDRVLGDNPRLVSARRLVEDGAVTPSGAGWSVASADYPKEVRREDGGLVCTCEWQHKHAGSRGPCKHVLAVLILLQS